MTGLSMWNSGIMHLKKLEPAIKCPEEFIKVAAFTENALSVVYSTTATARPLTFTYTRSIDRVPWTQFPLRIPLPPSFFFFLFFFFLTSLFLVTRPLHTCPFLSSSSVFFFPPFFFLSFLFSLFLFFLFLLLFSFSFPFVPFGNLGLLRKQQRIASPS